MSSVPSDLVHGCLQKRCFSRTWSKENKLNQAKQEPIGQIFQFTSCLFNAYVKPEQAAKLN